jgi:hypothetical protein
MKSVRVATTLFMVGVLFTGSVFAAGQPNYQTDVNLQAEASKLLKEVQSRAGELSRDAERLDSYTRGGLSRQSHGAQLTLVKDQINAIGLRLEILQAIRNQAAPWQQQAIDSVVPVAVNLAAHTEAAILHLNGSGNVLWHPDYTGHLRAIADRSGRVKDTIDLHLEMASTTDKLERLRDRVNDLND